MRGLGVGVFGLGKHPHLEAHSSSRDMVADMGLLMGLLPQHPHPAFHVGVNPF